MGMRCKCPQPALNSLGAEVPSSRELMSLSAPMQPLELFKHQRVCYHFEDARKIPGRDNQRSFCRANASCQGLWGMHTWPEERPRHQGTLFSHGSSLTEQGPKDPPALSRRVAESAASLRQNRRGVAGFMSRSGPEAQGDPLRRQEGPKDPSDRDGGAVVFLPEVVEDGDGAALRATSREPVAQEDPSADVAKSRWLVDRELNVSEDGGRDPYGSSAWIPAPPSEMGRLRTKLAQRENEAKGQRGGSPALPLQQQHQALRKAERRGRPWGRGGQGATSRPLSFPSLKLSGAVLVLLLSGGLGLALLIGQRAQRYQPAGPSLVATSHVLGHKAVEEAPEADLKPVLADGSVLLRAAAANAFLSMQAEARRQGVYLLPLSGFRSVRDQQAVFYGVKAERNQNIRDRAKVSAPPGFSEHHTGYAVDIGDAMEPATHLEFDFESTEAFSWLQRNANRFHFELSFPPDNERGIMYEPWHWRFVGNDHATLTFYESRPSNVQVSKRG